MALLFNPEILSYFPRKDAERLWNKINWLWLNREYVNHEYLSGNLSGFYKERVGKYRIIYTYDGDSDDMIIHLVGPRDTIYKNAEKYLH